MVFHVYPRLCKLIVFFNFLFSLDAWYLGYNLGDDKDVLSLSVL